MTLLSRCLIAAVMLFLGMYAFLIERHGHDYDYGLFYEIQYAPLLLLCCFTLAAFLLDRTSYKLSPHWYQYSFTVLGLALIVAVFIQRRQTLGINELPTLMTISNRPGASHVIKLELKAAGRFKETESSILDESVYYGRYQQEGDSVFITNANSQTMHPLAGKIAGTLFYGTDGDTLLVER